MNYIFKSERLGFRDWSKDDIEEFTKINADPDVMEYFPKLLTREETINFIERLQKHYDNRGYCYFATEIIKTGEFIGFIGLAYQDYKTDFNPSVDIGWRLKKSAWGYGYATEGAKRCIDYGFKELELDRIIAVCTVRNYKSENIMKKLGMTKKGSFDHSKLKYYPGMKTCIWYEIKKF